MEREKNALSTFDFLNSLYFCFCTEIYNINILTINVTFPYVYHIKSHELSHVTG